jgi:hypothetical protein
VWMLLSGDDVVTQAFGVLSILFFGGGGVFWGINALRRGVTQVTLTPAGIELTAGGTVPWQDIAELGTAAKPTKLVWLRLHSYDRFVASLPADTLAAHPAVGFVRPGRGRNKGAAGMLAWNRRHFGYDMGIAATWLDRPVAEFAELLEQYRRAATSQ